MFIYKTTGDDALRVAFIAELRIHISIIERAYKTLYKQHLYARGDKIKDNTCSPIELMTDFSLFLNSTAMLNKILGLSENSQRAEELRDILNIKLDKMNFLKEIALRNSLEHMDTRLDSLAKLNPKTIVIWDLTEKDSSEGHTLRKFNPLEFTMSCIHRNLSIVVLNILDCYSEVQYIKSCVDSREANLKLA